MKGIDAKILPQIRRDEHKDVLIETTVKHHVHRNKKKYTRKKKHK